jgi:thiamine monophosphate synthase
LIPPNIPLVAIGGIGDVQTAKLVKMAGADSVAVIGAITKAKDIEGITQQLLESMG